MKKEDCEDITPKVAERVIADAKKGDRDAALQVLGLFVHAVKNELSIDPLILAYLADCFDAALDASNPNNAIVRALNLGRPDHRTRGQNSDARDEALALEVFDHIRAGKTLDDAVHAVVDEYRRYSPDVVRHAWRNFKNSKLIQNSDPVPDN
jgi:hypothetical protein